MNDIVESNKRICKTCLKIRDRVAAGKFPNGRDKKWTDQSGKQWVGSTCPDCVIEKSKLRMQQKRAKKESV
jgi:hypothetical protein